MEQHANACKSNIRYAKITLKKRQQLVNQVLEKDLLVSKVAKKLHLKLSTAKLILKRYKEEGTFFESKAEMAKRQQNGGESTRKTSKKQRTSQLPNQLPENCFDQSNYDLNMPQFFFLPDNWIQTFPFAFPAFQNLMFNPF